MQLYRFEHMGRVCSGEFRPTALDSDSPEFKNYEIEKGRFIYVLIMVIYGMIALMVLSIVCLAFSLKYQRKNFSFLSGAGR